MSATAKLVLEQRNLTYVRINRNEAHAHWLVLADALVWDTGHNFGMTLPQIRLNKAVAGIHGHRANRRRMMKHLFRERQIARRLQA